MTQQIQNKQLPNGWKEERLGNLCIINPSKAEVKNLDENLEVSFIPMAYVSEEGKITSMDKRHLKEVKKGFTFFKNGDVLLAKITPCFENGKKAIAEGLTNGIGFGTTEFYIFRVIEEIIPKWIYYNLSREDFRALAKRSMGGAVGQQRVSKEFIENFKIVYPSKQEQSLIVSAIETQFSRLEEAVKVLKSVKDKLRIYRKAVLKKAFEGKLIAFDKVKSGKLSEFVDSINSGYACGRHSRTGKGIIHFRPYNIDVKGNVSFDAIKIVDPNYSNKRLEYGDVVFNNTNSQVLVGKTCYYNREEVVGFSNHMTQIKVKKDILDFKYLASYLHFLYLKGFYYSIMKSHVNQSSVNIDRLSNIELNIPSIIIQEQIVQSIESKFSVIDKVEETVNQSLLKAEKLRKSILKSAFEGKLVNMKEVKDEQR